MMQIWEFLGEEYFIEYADKRPWYYATRWELWQPSEYTITEVTRGGILIATVEIWQEFLCRKKSGSRKKKSKKKSARG